MTPEFAFQRRPWAGSQPRPVSFSARAFLVHGTLCTQDWASLFPLICYLPYTENVNCPHVLLFLGNGVIGPFHLFSEGTGTLFCLLVGGFLVLNACF